MTHNYWQYVLNSVGPNHVLVPVRIYIVTYVQYCTQVSLFLCVNCIHF